MTQPQLFIAGGADLPLTRDTHPAPAPTTGQEPLRHILLGSPAGVRNTIYTLHHLHYAEAGLWSPLLTVPNPQLILTAREGEVMSMLLRYIRAVGD